MGSHEKSKILYSKGNYQPGKEVANIMGNNLCHLRNPTESQCLERIKNTYIHNNIKKIYNQIKNMAMESNRKFSN